MRSFLIEAEGTVFHIEDTISEDRHEVIIKDLKEGNYTHKRRFSFGYMGMQDYLYLDCRIKLNVSYANRTFDKLKKLCREPEGFSFKFNLLKGNLLC